jgi:thiol:disulfide interchange protein DsbC
MRAWIVAGLRIAVITCVSGSSFAADYSVQKEKLQTALPDFVITSVGESPIPGLLEVAVGADVYYASPDGNYFVQAEIFDLNTRTNITEVARDNARAGYVDEIEAESAILFAAKDSQYTVTVFTDIDCGYCRKLHGQMSDYNDLGISIRYLFFPRSGPDTDSWAKAESVWCAASRQQALTQAKNGASLPVADCGTTPIASHYKLVNELGLTGTPALFTEGGQLLIGYRDPAQLLTILEDEIYY